LGSTGETAIREIGKHLIGCESCRAQLPPPTLVQFRNALLFEAASENRHLVVNEPHGLIETFAALIHPLRQKNVLVLTGAAFLVLLGTSFLLLLSKPGQPQMDNEIARSVENERPESKITRDGIVEPAPNTTNDSGSHSANPKSFGGSKALLTSNVNRQSRNISPSNGLENKTHNQAPGAERGNIATSRGGSSPCGDQKFLGFEFVPSSGTVLLKWEKVPKAVKYHLYISDDEEILVDEYETSEQTSYALKKPLDSGKVYKWKVVIELENGRTMVGVSQKFTSKDLQPSQKGTVKRLNTEIRCSSSN
jgi:hypothetical protein